MGFQTSLFCLLLVIVKQDIKLIFHLPSLLNYFFTPQLFFVDHSSVLLEQVKGFWWGHLTATLPLPPLIRLKWHAHMKKRKTVTFSLKGCFFRCRSNAVASVDELAQMTSPTWHIAAFLLPGKNLGHSGPYDRDTASCCTTKICFWLSIWWTVTFPPYSPVSCSV